LTINPDIFSPLVIAFIVFSLHAVAYLSESIKGGLLSVDTDQIEAAQTVGLSTIRTYKEIILPQAFSYALPNIENQFIMLIKGTSLAFAVQVTEIMAVSHVIANEGMTMVIVTHEIQFAKAIADQILFIDEGKILKQGTPQSVLESSDSKRINRFLNTVEMERDLL